MRLLVRLISCLGGGLLALAEPARAAWPAATPQPTGRGAEFIQNLGQWPAPVRFAAALHGGQLFAEGAALTYVLAAAEPAHPAGSLPHGGVGLVPTHAHAYRVQVMGAREAQVAGQQPSGVGHSYFVGPAASWARRASGFGQVQYAGLYAGIDLAVYSNQRAQLEYTFTVRPGGQPAAIRLRYAGLTGLRLDGEGRLRLQLPIGSVTELAPVAWQTDSASGQRQPVACRFRLVGDEVGFELGSYDLARPLIIDPVVLFATFAGSQADNWGHTATYDAQGNFYSASTVFSYGYPASPGAYDPSFNGSVDVALIKYNPRATGPAARVWATYLGGSQIDAPHRLAVTARGEVVVLGSTASADFPTTDGAFDRHFHGGPAIKPDGIAFDAGADLFVARLAADGDQLVGSTYLGGSSTDGFSTRDSSSPTSEFLAPSGDTGNGFSGGLQVDAAGEVYVATTTSSPDFAGASPLAPGTSVSDGLVVRLSADQRTVRWQRRLGGTAPDAAYDLVLTPDGTTAYVCGGTLSPDFRPTPGAYAPATLGHTDGFVARLAAIDGHLEACCRLGTAQDDQALLLALDASGNVLVTGLTYGALAISPGRYGLPGSNFLTQLTTNLRQLLYTTPLGGYYSQARMLSPVAFGLDACDQIYVAFIGRTAGYPASPGTPAASLRNFYALRLSAGARSLDYATRLPGDHVHGRSRFDAAGRLYLAVCGDCDHDGSFAVPPGVNTYSASNAASDRCNDAALLVDLSPAAAGTALPTSVVCVGTGPVPLGGSPAGGTWVGPGVSGSATTGYFFVPTSALIGSQRLSYQPPAGSPACAGPLSLTLTVALPTPVTFPPPAQAPVCLTPGEPLGVPLTAQPSGGYFSGPGVVSTSSVYSPGSAYFAASDVGPGTYTISYTLPGTDGRCGSASQTITVAGTRLVVGPDTTLCGAPFRAFQLRARPAGGTWSGPGVSASGWFDPALVPAFTTGSQGGYVTPIYSYTGPDGCRTVRSAGIYKIPAPITSQLLPAPSCRVAPALAGYAPFQLKLPPVPTYDASNIYPQFSWDFGDGYGQGPYSSTPDTVHLYTRPGTYAPVLTVTYGYAGGCTRTIRYAPFTIGEAPPLPNIITPNADGLNDTFVQQQFCEPPQLRVFSRWGQQVYQQAAYDNSWGGQGLPAGTYYYLLNDQAGQRPAAKGWLEIVR